MSQPLRWSSGNILLPVIIIIVLLGVGGIGLKIRQVQKQNTLAKQAAVCGNDDVGKDIKKNINVLSPTYGLILKTFADKVEKLSGHEKSANCMYILAAYNAYSGNFAKAKADYASLQTLKGQGIKIDSSYSDQVTILDQYMKNIDALENQYKAADQRLDPNLLKTATNAK